MQHRKKAKKIVERENISLKKTKKAFNGVIEPINKKVGKSITRCKATFKGTVAVDVDD